MDEKKEFEFILKFAECSDDLYPPRVIQQLRCLWTAFCLHHSLGVNMRKYDSKMSELWNAMRENAYCPYSSLEYERFYNAMSKFLELC